MAYETILYEVSDNILTITLNRPERLNAFTLVMQRELIEAFDQADADDAVGASIVTGSGRAFCAGADLSAGGATFDPAAGGDWPAPRAGPDGAPDLSDEAARDGGGQVALRIFSSLKPVIAAVSGPAVGVGVTMQLPMDVRIAHRTRASALSSSGGASCPRPARAGSCRASSASRRRWNGVSPAGCSLRRRRWPAGL